VRLRFPSSFLFFFRPHFIPFPPKVPPSVLKAPPNRSLSSLALVFFNLPLFCPSLLVLCGRPFRANSGGFLMKSFWQLLHALSSASSPLLSEVFPHAWIVGSSHSTVWRQSPFFGFGENFPRCTPLCSSTLLSHLDASFLRRFYVFLSFFETPPFFGLGLSSFVMEPCLFFRRDDSGSFLFFLGAWFPFFEVPPPPPLPSSFLVPFMVNMFSKPADFTSPPCLSQPASAPLHKPFLAAWFDPSACAPSLGVPFVVLFPGSL